MALLNTLQGWVKLLNRIIWLVVLLIILAALGRRFLADSTADRAEARTTAPILKVPVRWEQIEKDFVIAIRKSHGVAEAYARERIDAWVDRLMVRVNEDFLDWYFSYWTQQTIGLKGLYNSTLHYLDATQPTAAERLTQEIQEEFARRVLQPEISQLELENITRDVVTLYVDSLRTYLDKIPERYNIPRAPWQRYLAGIALMTTEVEGGRRVPLTLKAITATSIGGAFLLAKPLKVAIGKIGSKVSAKLAAKSAAKVATKTGEKVAAKAGGKMLGAIIGVGIIVWDVWDHQQTKAEFKPVLRRNIRNYLNEVKDSLLYDTETGILSVIYGIENEMLLATDLGKRTMK